ncbi:MAG: NAD(P)/FAD-dependent oxidoreductase [Rhodobacter sp.]|nr:NAD(P)/FAD-dependent oxidoreductase [Rhodobacter sp.]
MRVIIIGAGPSGLACAACLSRTGIQPEILERADCVGSAWHNHYDRLHLHTSRGRSGLPFRAMPKRYGRYASRLQMVEYLEDYARAFDLKPQFGAAVETVRPSGTGWRVAHSGGSSDADAVIFATGLNGTPHRPAFPGQASFPGPVLHTSEYRTSKPFLDGHTLVIGFGNSGGDIALDLAEAGARVTLSVRGPVNILPHEVFGLPVTSLGGLRKILPYTLADALFAPIVRAHIGRPRDYGLQEPEKGPAAQVIEDGRIPLIDIGALAAIRAGRIATRRGIRGIDGAQVTFADDTTASFDAIILATGYRVNLAAMLPETPEALDDKGHPKLCGAPGSVPGLFFCSYKASPDGQLNQSGIEARAIARAISNG